MSESEFGISGGHHESGMITRKWVKGRKQLFDNLRNNYQPNGKKVVWFHCASLGEFEQGRSVTETLKNENPDLYIVLTFYSPSGYEVRKDYPNAETFYLKGLRKDGQMNYALLNLSSLYNAVGKNDASLQMLKRALANDNNNERIYYNMALLYNEMNNKPAAEKSFSKAVELKSTNPRVYYNYGLMLNDNKKHKEAEAILQKGISINPTTPDLYYALTFVYIQSNNKSKAQQTAFQLKQMDPSNPNYQELFMNLGL